MSESIGLPQSKESPAGLSATPVRCATSNQASADDRSDRVCVLGAGTSGLAVAKNLKQQGIVFDCLEREDQIGGNWCYGKPHSSVAKSTHLISSKKLTEYTDFPMPKDYPEFPSQQLVSKYLKSYAEHFKLYDEIELEASVDQVQRHLEGGWDVRLANGQTRRYGKLVICNGHNWDPRFPEYDGDFTGLQLHSADYKTPEIFEDKRVLVIGAGNSGCDIAVDAVQRAENVCLSMRRGYHFLPKFFHGTPIDICGERVLRWRFPLPVRRLLAAGMRLIMLGQLRPLGFPKPDHRLFESHPVINSQLVYHVGHGDIRLRGDVRRFDDSNVVFVDGTSEPFDVVVYATGFKVSFPFLNREELNWQDGKPNLFLNIFHPEHSDLFCAGLIQPDSGQWGLVDYQAQLIAKYLQAKHHGAHTAGQFDKLKQQAIQEQSKHVRGVEYLKSPRHLLEVEHFSYRKTLKKHLRRFA